MQTEAEAFLQRIRANPDDDGPRLVFADWLDEQGDPRGTFIRVQLALAQLDEEGAKDPHGFGRAKHGETRKRLLNAERELREGNEEQWKAPFLGLAYGLEFRRGFIEEIKVDARDFVRHAHELFKAAPLRHIHLLNLGGSLTTALQCHYLSRLAALTIHASHTGEPLARAVAGSEHLAGLKRLALTRNRFEDDAAEHLASSPMLAGLEHLDLSGNDLGETGARALAASPHLGSLHHLELRGNRLGPVGAAALAGSERLPHLQHLGLAENEIGVSRLLSLSNASDLLRAPDLDLSGNGLGAAGLQVILTRLPGPAEPDAVRLQELDLSHNPLLGDGGASVLARCPHLGGVRVLRIAGCEISDDGARALAESRYLNQLVSLDLGNNPIGDPGFQEFLDSRLNLRYLNYPIHNVSIRMRQNLNDRFNRNRQ